MRAAVAAAGVLLLLLPPAASRTFRYIALGDFGTGGYKWGSHPEVSCALQFHELAEEIDAQLTISVGDNSYIDSLEGMRDSFEDTWNKPGSHGGGTWFAAAGNHDNIGPQINYHSAKTSNNKWYLPGTHYTKVIDSGLGFNVQIWNVDSNDKSAGQRGWLQSTLKESTARWKIIITHFPWTNSGRHGRMPSPTWIAQDAKQHGVQVFFNGHDHILQTSVSDGVAFVTTGAVARGGMMNRGIDQDKTQFVWTVGTKTSVPGHGMMSLQLTRDVMWGTMYAFGGVVHEFVTVWDWPQAHKNHPPATGGSSATSFPSPQVVKSYLSGTPPQPAQPPPTPSDSAPAPPPTPPPPVAAAPPVRGGGGGSAKQRALAMIAASDATRQTPAPQTSPQPAPKAQGYASERRTQAAEAAAAALYVASSECTVCPGPSAGHLITIWIQGVEAAGGKHRVFLSKTEHGCAEQPAAAPAVVLPGGEPREVTETGIVRVIPDVDIKDSMSVFVCLSADGGGMYDAVKHAESGLTAFSLYPRPPAAQSAGGFSFANTRYHHLFKRQAAAPPPAGPAPSGGSFEWPGGSLLFFIGAASVFAAVALEVIGCRRQPATPQTEPLS